ncbi:hypothetical protein MVI01_10680 [Myxococcus virescens]|uniref:Uncharacterized protein n=1 Tax=Myxococcus virescens TaxID=83456 RepID=A0A511H794_9BACT|nr:hypothetical protein MVI01_10680 [Myxococcus virescens]
MVVSPQEHAPCPTTAHEPPVIPGACVPAAILQVATCTNGLGHIVRAEIRRRFLPREARARPHVDAGRAAPALNDGCPPTRDEPRPRRVTPGAFFRARASP